MAPVPASVAKQAELLKQDGNNYFKKDRLGAAIDAYTEAHGMLGLALLERQDYAGGIEELEKAFDSKQFTGRCCLGLVWHYGVTTNMADAIP